LGIGDAARERARIPALRWALGGIVFAAASAGCAAEAPRIPAIAVLEDASARLGVEAAAASRGFQPLAGARLNASYSRSAFWLRLELPPASAAGERVVLELAAPVLDRVEVFALSGGAWRRLGASGDGVAFAERALPHRLPAFPVALASAPTPILVRVAGEGALNAPVRLWSEAGFHAAAAGDNLFFGVYFGFLAAMLTYNLFLFGAVRDQAYLWYVAYIGALLLLQAKLTGYADEYLWPGAPGLANPINLFAFAAVVVFGAQFTQSFLRRAPLARWMPRLIVSSQAAAVLAAALLVVASYRAATQALLAVSAVVIAVLVSAMVHAFRRGFRPARFILVAFAALAAGAAAMILRQFGVLGPGVPAERIFDVATAAEALLLSFALGDRINAIEAERRRAETALGALERRLPGALLEAQEHERRRMAAELHDAVGQNLAVVGSRIRALAEPARAGRDAGAALSEIAEVNRETLDQVRAMARSLHPVELERLGLARALQMMAERAVADSGLALEIALDPVGGLLPAERHIQLYRIAQEAVTNAVKHSRGRRLVLTLKSAGADLSLTIADDGAGFDPAARSPSMGLATMRHRAALLNASLAVESMPGSGTAIRLLVPAAGGP
jgi:signal transduction histidine kinase